MFFNNFHYFFVKKSKKGYFLIDFQTEISKKNHRHHGSPRGPWVLWGPRGPWAPWAAGPVGRPFFKKYRNYIKNTIFYKIRKIDKNRFLTYIKNTFDQKN